MTTTTVAACLAAAAVTTVGGTLDPHASRPATVAILDIGALSMTLLAVAALSRILWWQPAMNAGPSL